MIAPEISTIMLTYKHGPYLKEAIEGVLKQKTDFKHELIICNDASPDKSDEIIRPYVEKYPDIIRYYRHDKNIGFEENQRFAFEKCRGKYVAYCEGDDYWTDENKLQFQYDFLENNPDYIMTTARTESFIQNEKRFRNDGKDGIFGDRKFVDYTQASFFKERPTQTLTYLIRRGAIDLKWIDVYPDYRDGGIFSALDIEKQVNTSINLFKNIKKENNDDRADIQILKDYDTLINKYYYIKNFPLPLTNKNLFQMIWERYHLSKNKKILLKQVLNIFRYSIFRSI